MVSGDKRFRARQRQTVGPRRTGRRSAPSAACCDEREKVELTGTFRCVKPGLARIPGERRAASQLAGSAGDDSGRSFDRLDRGTQSAGMSDDALPLPIPRYVGDIRVANGKVTLYKTVQ